MGMLERDDQSMRKILLLVLTVGMTLIIGCSGNGSAVDAPPDTGGAMGKAVVKDPVSIAIGLNAAMLTEADFKTFVTDPVNKKFPYITTKYVNVTPQTIKELIASGTIPDIVINWVTDFADFNLLGLDGNMDPLIKSEKFDLKRIDPVILDSVKLVGDRGYLTGIPFLNNSHALFYNRDLFDRFGVPVPKDHMTWGDAIQLATKMSRVDGGVQYRGIYPDNPIRGLDQLSLPKVNFANNTSALSAEPVKRVYELWLRMFNIPGNAVGEYRNLNAAIQLKSFTQGDLAMLASHSGTIAQLNAAPSLNWDLVTYPVHPEAPDIGQRVAAATMSIARQSLHKVEAFKVIETVLSNEVQTMLSENGRPPVVLDQKIKSQFGKAIPGAEHKNLSALTKLKSAMLQSNRFVPNTSINQTISAAFNDILAGKKDVNTALRDADEKLNQVIKENLNR
jgi:multiple sugar transport system substrate-binding protein